MRIYLWAKMWEWKLLGIGWGNKWFLGFSFRDDDDREATE
jgi:hypothetical protein